MPIMKSRPREPHEASRPEGGFSGLDDQPIGQRGKAAGGPAAVADQNMDRGEIAGHATVRIKFYDECRTIRAARHS